MSKPITKLSRSGHKYYKEKHRFEHWYVDNQIYFITARCRNKYPAFASSEAKAIFWDRFDHYTNHYEFKPWVTSLLDNHYHTLGYLRQGKNLQTMMQRIHGSVSKLVNDILESQARPASAGRVPRSTNPARLLPFWRNTKGREYFDGCIRDEKQCRLAYRYTLTQSKRHNACSNWKTYEHTHVLIDLERGLRRAHELSAFMEDVPYKRYERK
ncbi:MAG: transposase [Planctomycetes bacterium]|nr:transposase [Planctomycetota bacterium]